MSLRFVQPEWFWLLVIVLPCAWIAARWLTGMSPARRFSAVLARCVVIALVAALLAGASRVHVTDRVAVVAVVDVSDSVRRFVRGAANVPTLDQVRAYIESVQKQRRIDDLLGIVVFDGAQSVVATPTRGSVADRTLDLRMADGTNIADAITFAGALIPPGAAGRVLLFSDGNQTAGDAVTAARRLSAGGSKSGRRSLPIDVVPLDYDVKSEVVVESVDAPPRATAEAPISVRVVLNATAPASGVLRLTDNGVELDINGELSGTGRTVSFGPGRRVEQLDVRLGPERVHRFRAVFEPDAAGSSGASVGDTLADNNAGETFTITPGRGSVLIADGVSDGQAGGAGSTLAKALLDAGIGVTVVPPGGIPGDLLELQDYDLVVLENVASDAVPRKTQEALVAHVRDLGGGLLMVGGPDSFGAGGWRGTALEPILPVRLELPERLIVPETAIVFVIDNSGSMSRQVRGSLRSQQEIANEAVALAIRSLDKQDMVGVVTFNSAADTAVPLGRNVEPGKTADTVRAIGPGGGTNMLPALEIAHDALRSVNAKVKHIIVLSDGRSQDEDALAPAAAAMVRDQIKVSTIAIGDAANLQSMADIARQGEGVYYQVIDPNMLPRVFLRAVRVVRTPMVREEPFTPRILPTGSPIVAGLGSPAKLLGLTLTQARSEPTITLAMVTDQGEPVLAHWSVELGQVGAFTSDAHKWAEPWLSWEGYRTFWTQAARVLSRPAMRRGFVGRADMTDDGLRVRLEAADDNGRPMDGLDVPATVYGPRGEPRDIRLNQVEAGVYEGLSAAPEAGTYVVVIKPSSGGKRMTPVIAGVSRAGGIETRSLSSDKKLLERIAETGNGRVLTLTAPGAVDLYDRAGISPQESLAPMWRSLLAALMVTLLLDIGTRRIAWDRWVSSTYGVELKRAAEEAVRDRGSEASRTLGELKVKPEVSPIAARPSALNEQDAEALAAAARDRRRSERLAALRAGASPTATAAPSNSSQPTAADGQGSDAGASASATNDDVGGLAAAKRRARQRFEE